MLPTLAPLGLLALAPIGHLVRRRGLSASVAARPSIAVLAVLLIVALMSVAADAGPLLSRCWNSKPSWYSLRAGTPEPGESRAIEIARLTHADDVIYVLDWDPVTCRYAYRRSASRFATIEKLGQVGRHTDFILAGAIADIMSSPPTVFVISTGDYAAIRGDQNDRFGQWIGSR